MKNVYTDLFSNNTYNVHPDDEIRYKISLEYLDKYYQKGDSIIDISSGRGTLIKLLLNCNYPNNLITSTDLQKFHNYDVNFIQLDLNEKENIDLLSNNQYKFLFALDCLEHLKKENIENAILFLAKISYHSVFTIANHEEIIEGNELHLIQENINFWEDLINKYYKIKEKGIMYNNRLYIFKLISKI